MLSFIFSYQLAGLKHYKLGYFVLFNNLPDCREMKVTDRIRISQEVCLHGQTVTAAICCLGVCVT